MRIAPSTLKWSDKALKPFGLRHENKLFRNSIQKLSLMTLNSRVSKVYSTRENIAINLYLHQLSPS